MNTRQEELNFLLNILIDLKSYPGHNIYVLDSQIEKIKFLINNS